MNTSPISLVTGAAGFIGSHVAQRLLAKRHRVLALDNLSGGSPRNVPAGAEFIEAEVSDFDAVHSLFEEYRPQFVFHLAAYAAEGLSPFIRSFNYSNNVVASAGLISCAIEFEVQRFVFTSSIAVYGDQPPPFTEASPKAPIDPYGLAKAVVEDDLELARRQFGLSYTIFRPHNVYGERQNINDPYRNVIGIFMRQCLTGEPLTIFGNGEQTRAFSYIGDVVPSIVDSVTIAEAKNAIFNVGGDSIYSVNDLAIAVAGAMQTPLSVRHLPARHEARAAHCSHDRQRQVFGPLLATPLTEGLARMAKWARSVGVQASTPCPCRIEVQRGLPDVWSRFANKMP